MDEQDLTIHQGLRAPRAAALAGFSVLLIARYILIWVSIPANRASLAIGFMGWAPLVSPIWIILISVAIVLDPSISGEPLP